MLHGVHPESKVILLHIEVFSYFIKGEYNDEKYINPYDILIVVWRNDTRSLLIY